ncbi:hypothetical protein ILYODFUR_014256 [Ilyodon furcidens]|uniref:Uncharacterized protein n=1 Tax=Ilyodon furcidens TaxID=33524 RepID=A0ABV0VFG6_9TELE
MRYAHIDLFFKNKQLFEAGILLCQNKKCVDLRRAACRRNSPFNNKAASESSLHTDLRTCKARGLQGDSGLCWSGGEQAVCTDISDCQVRLPSWWKINCITLKISVCDKIFIKPWKKKIRLKCRDF